MKRYDSYKDSGVEWIGEIPSHWDGISLGKIGVLYGGLTGKSGDDFRSEDFHRNKPYIPFTNIFNNTYISKEQFQYVHIESDEIQNRVEKYDLFFLMSSESYEDLGKCSILVDDVEELYLNSFCKGFRVHNKKVSPLFLNYQLVGDSHKKLISIEGNGFTRINLRQDRLKETPIFIPPLSEQQQIVSFLDSKTSQIDELIQKKERKIELLKEKRLKLIEEIILNPNILRVRLGFISEITERPVNRVDDKFYTKVGMYNWGRGIFKYPEVLGLDLGDSTFNYLKEGDLLLSGQFSWEGSVSLVGLEEVGCISSHRFHILNGKKGVVLNEYLWSYFTSGEGHFILNENSPGSAGRNKPLNIGKLLKEKIPLPDLKVQQEFKELFVEYKKVENYTVKSIELLKEYRQSLISEVVTGKIKP